MSEKKAGALLNAEEGEVLSIITQHLMELCRRGYGDAISIYCQVFRLLHFVGTQNYLQSIAALVAEASLDAMQGHLGLRKYLAVFSDELMSFLKALEEAKKNNTEIPKEKMDAMWAGLTERLSKFKPWGVAEVFRRSPLSN